MIMLYNDESIYQCPKLIIAQIIQNIGIQTISRWLENFENFYII